MSEKKTKRYRRAVLRTQNKMLREFVRSVWRLSFRDRMRIAIAIVVHKRVVK